MNGFVYIFYFSTVFSLYLAFSVVCIPGDKVLSFFSFLPFLPSKAKWIQLAVVSHIKILSIFTKQFLYQWGKNTLMTFKNQHICLCSSFLITFYFSPHLPLKYHFELCFSYTSLPCHKTYSNFSMKTRQQ